MILSLQQRLDSRDRCAARNSAAKSLLMWLLMVLLVWLGTLAASGVRTARASEEVVPHIRHTLVVYFMDEETLEHTQHSLEAPVGFVRVDQLPVYPAEPAVSFEFVEDYQSRFPIPSADTYEWFAHGISEAINQKLQVSPSALVAKFGYALQDASRSLRLANEWVHQVALFENAVIYDAATLQLFDAGHWESFRLTGWNADTPVMSDHIMVHVYQHQGATRAVTRGMKKFGLPDLVSEGFDEALSNLVVRLLYLSAQTLVERGGLLADDMLNLNISNLTETRLKDDLVQSMDKAVPGKYLLPVREAIRLDDDPDNALIELLLDEGVGQTPTDRRRDVLHSLFGLTESQ